MDRQIPCFLFHETCPNGKLFYDAPSRDEALAAGWVTGPHLIKPKAEPAPTSAPVEEKPAPKPKKPRGKGKK